MSGNIRAVFLKRGDLCPNVNCRLPVFKDDLETGRRCNCSRAGVVFIKHRKRSLKYVDGKLIVIEEEET